MGNGTAVCESSGLYAKQRKLGKWHRSKDTKQKLGSSFSSYMMNKKWWLEQEFTNHLMRFQQVEDIN